MCSSQYFMYAFAFLEAGLTARRNYAAQFDEQGLKFYLN